MALAYSSVPEKDFSLGIDARSSESSISPGFVRDLLNADIVEKRVRKRNGYQGYGGNLPLRVFATEYNNTNDEVCFTLDTSISLEQVRSSPIVVYGRSGTNATGTGPLTGTDSVHYYPGFTVPIRKEWTAPSGTLTVTGEEHAQNTTNMFVSIVESTSLTSRDYSFLLSDAIRISEASPYDINIDYTTVVDRNVFVFYKDRDTVTGTSYVSPVQAHSGAPVSQTFSFAAGTHNLSNFNIIAQIHHDTGSERVVIEADSIEISTTGTVSVTISNDTGVSQNYYIILSAAPVANSVTGTVAGSSTGTVVINGVTSPWIFYGIYLEQTPGGIREVVYADNITYDDTTGDVTLEFTNLIATARQFIVYYEYGELRSNQLCVTDSLVTASGMDSNPQITLWGLEHTELYSSGKELRESWVSHIDSYRRSGEQRLISGLGGNLFRTMAYSEAATQYSYPLLYPNLNARTSTNSVLGPTFWDTGETPERTRGYITADDAGTHLLRVTSVSYDTGLGWTKYVITAPNMDVFNSSGVSLGTGAASSVISSTTSLEDYLTVTQMSYSLHNGTFRIRQVTSSADTINIWVENSANSSDYDDAGVGGEAGIFTDQYTWMSSSPFIAEDTLVSAALGDSFICEVISSLGTITVTDGLTDRLELAPGILFLAKRTSDIVPLRSNYPTALPSVTNLVRGDMLSYSGSDELNALPNMLRQLRVLYINPDSDRTVGISVSSGIAEVTLSSGTTTYLSVGQKVLLYQAGVYSGIQEITSITGADTFEFSTSETASVASATLVGSTVQLDESYTWEDTAGDTNKFTCQERWIPIEAPDDSFDLTPTTYPRHFDTNSYSNQSFLRSTIVADNMYFTNYDDEVMKFDGSNIYRAGIIPWQPGLFTIQNQASTAKIVINNRTVAYTATVEAKGQVTIAATDIDTIPVGASVRIGASPKTYTIRDYTTDGTLNYIVFDRALESVGTTGNVVELATFRYYFRLNAVDVNSNIIASAVTGYQDHIVELTANASVQHKLVGLPAWDIYDYDRLEVEVYRTKQSQAAPFYKLTTLPMDFDNSQGYVVFTDTFADNDLFELDKVNTALKGAELGTNWSDPLRAKYITSAGNKLVLGNVRDYPQLDIQIAGDATIDSTLLTGDSLLFRRDNTDTDTTTSMPTRVRYEWVTDYSGTPGFSYPDANSFTVTGITQPVVAGDWIYLTYLTVNPSGRDTYLAGWWQINSVTGAGPYSATIKYTNRPAGAITPNRYVLATDPTDVPVLLNDPVTHAYEVVDGNLGMVNGDSFDTFDAMRRMALAINATMRMVDITASGMESYTPWLTARSGNDVAQAGRLLIRQPKHSTTSLEVKPTFSGYSMFINSVQRVTNEEVSATSRVYPSRLLVSYGNYPEIFDSPTTILDADSDSAIDINSADGQEITGIISFFGESAFGAAQQSGVIVVFKENSIYLVDINQKAAGANAVQRIETEGLGCTAPFSIASTKNGIMFANESGIYCLRRDQSIQYIGKYMERNWTDRVSLANLAICQGHHYGVGRAYKLSIPLDTTESYIENSEVYVYDHTGEDEGKPGAWSRYDNHPATGWANLGSNAFFASTNGRVFSVRNLGTKDDFRDDSSAIGLVLATRPTDFGDSGRRKVIGAVIIDYRITETNTGTSLKYSLDLEAEYTDTTAFTINYPLSSGLSGVVPRRVVTISHNIDRRRCIYFEVQLTNSTIDEGLEIPGITYKVAGLADKGILQAANT